MSLSPPLPGRFLSGFPRVSGDEPLVGFTLDVVGLFSPRERG